MTAGETLTHALLKLADANRQTPCQGRRHARWTSESSEDRAWATHVCQICPALALCKLASDEAVEKWHVWGGVDRTATTRKAAS